MKKLLLIAILMLALVITAVACTTDPVTEETTPGDTTVENPTEAPTAEPDQPTEAPTTPVEDPTAEPTEELTDVPTEPATTEKPEDPTTPPDDGPDYPDNRLVMNKTEFKVGEPILATAYGAGTDWIGIATRGSDATAFWWYVTTLGSGTEVNLMTATPDGTNETGLSLPLPSGEYTLYLVPDDKALSAGDIIASVDFVVIDPADPVHMIAPDFIHSQATSTGGATVTNHIGSSEVITEGKRTYVRLTSNGGDPYVAVIPIGSNYTLPQYMAISYRTNTTVGGQFFMGSGSGWSGQGDSFVVDWAEGDWSLMVIDLTQTGITSITDGRITYARLDFFAGNAVEGDYFDVQFIAFFNTAEYALDYDFKVNPPYVELDSAEAGKVANSFDTFYVNGAMYFPDGSAGDKLNAIDNTILFGADEAHESMKLRGWIGFNQPIAEFGYFVDNYTMVYGEFAREAEQGVKDAGGQYASRFEIQVPLTELSAGVHTVGFVAKLEDGTVVRLRSNNLKVIIVPYTEDEEIILAARAGGTTPIVPKGQTMGQRFTVEDGYLKQISVADMATYSDGGTNTWNFKLWAWDTDYDTTVATDPLYSVDGENHSDNQTLNVLIPIEKMIAGDVYYEVTYLSGSGGFTGWNAVGHCVDGLETYIAGALSDVHFASSIIVGVEADPNAIKMDSHNFQSNVAGNFADGSTADVDFLASDLTSVFTVTYGQGNEHPCFVKTGENGPYYAVGGFNSIRTSANGAYVFSLDDVTVATPGFSSIIVRANMAANREGQLYGSDGGDAGSVSHGGSGIYISMDGTNLVINVKSYVDSGDGTYASNKFVIAVDSNDIKIADDGNNVYVLAGDALVATIAISGTRDFGIKNVAADALAETVTITLIDGTSQTVDNAAVASRYNNGSLGVATRGGGSMVSFSAISLMPFDSIEIPEVEIPEAPQGPVILAWNAAGSTVKHMSQDGFKYLNADRSDAAEIVPPGQYNAQFSGTLEYTKGGHPFVADYGWVAMNAETFLFGYIIDNGEPVMNDAFTRAPSEPVKNAAASVGASNVSNFCGVIDLTLLETGEHTIKFVMQQNGAEYVVIRQYTIVVKDA